MKRHHGGQEEQSCWCSGFDLRVLCILFRKCDRLLTLRTCQAAIAPTTMNAKAAEVAKLSTTCNRESRDQVSRGSGRRRRREATHTGGLGPGNECPESHGHSFPDPNRLCLSAGCAGRPSPAATAAPFATFAAFAFIRSVRGRVASHGDPFSCDGVSALPLMTTPW